MSSGSQDARYRLGKALLAAGILTRERVEAELDRSDRRSSRMAKALLGCNFPAEADLIKVISKQIRVPSVKLGSIKVNKDIVGLIPQDLAEAHQIVALDQVGDILVVVTPNIDNDEGFAAVRRETACFVAPIRCSDSNGFAEAIPGFYDGAAPIARAGAAVAAPAEDLGDPDALAPLPVAESELAAGRAIEGWFVDVVSRFEHIYAQDGPLAPAEVED